MEQEWSVSEVKDDTISRQAVHDLIIEIDPYWAEGMTRAIYDGISKLPSTERHGRWKKCKKSAFFPDDDIFTCSECFHNYFKRTNYCPNCGAKMGGVSEDE